jgi:hypothetical protein
MNFTVSAVFVKNIKYEATACFYENTSNSKKYPETIFRKLVVAFR